MAHKISRRKSPRRGSLQYWPRKRSKKPYPVVRNWQGEGLLGFAGYKAGMTHILAIDNKKTSPTKGEKISMPVTIIEVPPLKIAGIRFYKKEKVLGEVWDNKLPKNIERKVQKAPKKKKDKKHPKKQVKTPKKLEDFTEYSHIRLIILTQPTFKKTPEIFEMGYEGTEFKELLGKELKIEEVFKPGEVVDVISISKGKGFQGVIKKFGAKLLSHKSEKKRRKAGSIGPWHPAKVSFRSLMPGRIGFHQRTEFNKWILKIGTGEEVNPNGGFIRFGNVKADYVMLKGSVPGPRKRLIVMRKSIRPHKFPNVAPEITHISKKTKQGIGA